MERSYIRYGTLSLVFLHIFLKLSAQTPSAGGSTVEVPEVIPPSPRAAAFNQYGEIPVGHTSGIPDISIPLYTLAEGDLEVPIVLRYHYNGLKPGDGNLTNVGLGWTLQVGGNINRSVRGEPDDLVQKAPGTMSDFLTKNEENLSDFLHLDSIGKGLYDSKYDLFTYRMNDRHGNFVLEDKGSGVFEAHNFPYTPIKITPNTAGVAGYYYQFDGFELIDERGTAYQFGFGQTSTVNTVSNPSMYSRSDWYLNEITASNGIDHVDITYAEIGTFTVFGSPHSDYGSSPNDDFYVEVIGRGREAVDKCSQYPFSAVDPAFNTFCKPTSGLPVSTALSFYYGMRTISKIEGSQEVIAFELTPDHRYIKQFTVKTKNGEVIKVFDFDNDQSFNGYDRPKLSGMSVKDIAGNVVERYTFSYDETVQIDLVNNSLADYSVDYWGYYNGPRNGRDFCSPKSYRLVINRGSCGNTSAENIHVGNADMDPAPSYARAFILEQVTYPTGGVTSFIYEGNSYAEPDGTVRSAGGLRVKKMTNQSESGEEETEYKYTSMQLPITIDALNATAMRHAVDYVSTGTAVGADAYTYHIIRQGRVRSIHNGWNPALGANVPRYAKVTEYQGSNLDNAGKTEYTYDFTKRDQRTIITFDGFSADVPFLSQDWSNGQLSSTTWYKKHGSGYSKVKKEQHDYLHSNRLLDEKNVYKACSYYFPWEQENPGPGFNSPLSPHEREYRFREGMKPLLNVAPKIYAAYPSKVRIGHYHKQRTTVTDYSDQGDSLVSITEFFHENPVHRLVTRIESTIEGGKKKVHKFKYPQDMTGGVYTSMVTQKNITSPVIEQTSYEKTGNVETLLSTTLNEYKQWTADVFSPEHIKWSKGSDPPETRLQYHSYDSKGHVTSLTRPDGVQVAYLWDQTTNYPYVQAIGADLSSLEQALAVAINSLPGYSNGLNDVGNLLDEIRKLDTPSKRATWQAFNTSLRNQLATALVSTYTYLIASGISSVTDENARTTYYEYDDYMRLRTIKDHDGYILNTYDYHYKGQN